jgi:two-component system chemotaxis response regulator CheY
MNGNVETALLPLPETLDLAASEQFLELVRQHVSGDAPLCIDASAVRILTVPCVQILLAALRGGESITIKDPSAAFIAAFEDLGLDWIKYLDRDPTAEQDEAQSQAGHNGEFAGNTELQAPVSGENHQSSDLIGLQPINESVMSKRILTIDDSKTMRDMLMLTLAEAGFDVIQAVDGQDGLDVLEKEQVDVIITDINMPRMDGYEVIRSLRKNPEHKTTPILVLTTESEAEKKNLAREAGATGWMVKPFDPDRLVATVRKVAP